MAGICDSTSASEPARAAAGTLLATVPELRATGAVKDFEVYAAPVGQPQAVRFRRRVNYYEAIAVLNVRGNEKGRNSHTVGPTRVDMANASIVQPPPLWRIEDPSDLCRLHPSLDRAKALYARLQERHRLMTALRGRISLAVTRLLLPPRVFQILEDRGTQVPAPPGLTGSDTDSAVRLSVAHLHGGLRSGIVENFTSTSPPVSLPSHAG